MNVDSCYQLGYVIKTHGLKGEITIFLDVDFPEEYQNMESVFVEIQQRLIPFFIQHIAIQGQKAIVKFDGVDDIESASELKSHKLFLPLENLPSLDEHQFYYHEVIGFEMLDKAKDFRGTVKEVLDMPNQDLFVVAYQSKEVLVPINDEIIEKVDKGAGLITVNLPEGLIDVYMEE
ncbi:MAG: ribosome maturation factor RimM [Bacteroidota bacterium]